MPTTLDKPAGLPVMPPHADPGGGSLLRALLEREPWRAAIAWPEGFEGGIAHRLDTPTSGLVLAADTIEELAALRAWFAGRRLRKIYRFVAARDVPWDDNTCDRPIAHDPRKKSRMVVQRGPSTPHRGRWYEAHTELARIEGRLWQAVITTGVTHQIRVHAAFLGLPLAGDERYGGGEGPFRLHAVAIDGPDGFRVEVPLPDWADRWPRRSPPW